LGENQSQRRLKQHLCLDMGYDNPTGRNAADNHQYMTRILSAGEENLIEQQPVPVSSMGGGAER